MSDPIKFTVVVESAEAGAQLQKFASQAGSGLKAMAKDAETAGKHLNNARMGLLELEHVGRSTVDIALMGGNSRMFLAQIPQLVQSLTLMGVSLTSILPYMAALGAAVGAGALGWKAYMGDLEDTTSKIDEMVAALDKVPALLEKIQGLQKSGLVSRAAGTEFADYLNGKKKLYVEPGGQVTAQAQHSETDSAIFIGADTPVGGFEGTRSRMVPNREATQAEINDYVNNQLPKVSAAQEQAVEKLKDLVEKARVENLQGLEKEKAQIHDRYEKERQEILLTAQQVGNLIGPKQLDAATNGAIADLNKAEANAKITAEKKAQEESDRKDAEVQRAYEAMLREELEFEKELTREQKQQLQDAEKRLELQAQLARTGGQVDLKNVSSNPFLTESEKAQQSIAPLQKLISINDVLIQQQYKLADQTDDEAARNQYLNQANELTLQQIDLRRQLQAAQGEDSFTYQLNLAMTHLKDMNNLAHEVAESFANIANSSIASVSHGITGLIMGTMTWNQFLAEIPQQIMTEIVGAIVQMGVRWVATRIMMATIGKALDAAGLASQIPTAAASFAMWAPAATAASIATAGAASGVGLAAFKAAEIASIAGFANGGLVIGPGTSTSDSIPARLSHGEYVIRADAVRHVGVGFLDDVNKGRFQHRDEYNRQVSGAATATPQPEVKMTHIVVHNDQQLWEMLKSSTAEHIITTHVFNNKARLGFQT